jgi:hypothetical protein
MEHLTEYKKYTEKFTDLYYKFNELIYLCDNFDINRINKFLINIIEYEDFHIIDDEFGEFSNGYSDIKDYTKLSQKITNNDEYETMINYMISNIENINSKYSKFKYKIQGFNNEYLKDIEELNPVIENFKNEYKIVISNLEEFLQRISEIYNLINNKDKIADTIHGFQIDIMLISNKNIMYLCYNLLKKFYYKNLHVINKDTYEITNSDLKEFKNKLYKIYSNIHDNFIDKFNSKYKERFDIEFIKILKDDIEKFRAELKDTEDKAEIKLKERIKKEAEIKATENEKENEKITQIIINAKQKESETQMAKTEYENAISTVNSLRKAIYDLEGEGKHDMDDEENMMEDVENDDNITISPSIAQPISPSIEADSHNGHETTQVIVTQTAMQTAEMPPSSSPPSEMPPSSSPPSEMPPSEMPPSEMPQSATAAMPQSATAAMPQSATAAMPQSEMQITSLDSTSSGASETDPMSRVSYLYLLTQNSITGLQKGDIPDRIWIIILLNEGWKGDRDKKYNTDKFNWKDIINKWQIKSNQKNTIGETEKRAYWDNAAKGKIRFSSEYYPIKPVAELQEILLIGEKPSDWTGYKSEKNLEKARNDEWMVFHLNKYQGDFLQDAAEKYFKDHHGNIDMMKYGYPAVVEEENLNIQKYGDQKVSVHGDIKDEFIITDKYKKNILQGFKFEKSGPYYYLQDKFEKGEDLNLESQRRRYYLTKEQMKFYDDYYDYYQNFGNLNESKAKIIKNKTLFILPQPNDRDIEEFKRVDKFLSAIYNDLIANIKTEKKDRNIIILPKSDERIYLKYISFFDEHYKDPILKVNENLIFIGKRYELKTKTDLDLYLKTL